MLLQNDLMRVLPPMNQTSLATNQLVKGCEKLLQKVESSSTFFFQNLYMLRVLLARGKLFLQQVT